MLLRSILGTVGVGKVAHVEHPRRALELLGMEHFSAVFYDPAIEAARAALHDGGPAGRSDAQSHDPDLRPAGTPPPPGCGKGARCRCDRCADHPDKSQDRQTKLRAATQSPRAFIAGADFFGPDRRAMLRPNYYGSDRRRRAPKKTGVDFTPV